MRRRRRTRLLVTCLVPLAILGTARCGTSQQPQQHGNRGSDQSEQGLWHGGSVPHLRADVIHVLPHDPSLFTQGLETNSGTLYESTGKHGESVLRAVDLTNGTELERVELPSRFFGEGITVVGDRIWQLSWKSGTAFLRDRTTLREKRRADYDGEGWGLCSSDGRLVMSDGSEELTFRDPDTFAERGGVTVRLDGEPVEEINELECVDGSVWANVWQTDRIVRIDPTSGRVTAVVNASGLLDESAESGAGVLNGIAATDAGGEFLLTGKYWPKMFRVRFVPE
ncbi:glutaminyl-peptide cyclotransferase [Actinopolyspora halophila]|uniref:glutaminyl-peptide cyclotransferase n=1 Tax=Actinopolyspora halophila TaxID=1850 RepID=UPI001FE10CDD|nr:glutaminyl-peptide cyclotransferase [Actinopolyspora halophila]